MSMLVAVHSCKIVSYTSSSSSSSGILPFLKNSRSITPITWQAPVDDEEQRPLLQDILEAVFKAPMNLSLRQLISSTIVQQGVPDHWTLRAWQPNVVRQQQGFIGCSGLADQRCRQFQKLGCSNFPVPWWTTFFLIFLLWLGVVSYLCVFKLFPSGAATGLQKWGGTRRRCMGSGSIRLGVWGNVRVVSSSSGVWGEAPAANSFCEF